MERKIRSSQLHNPENHFENEHARSHHLHYDFKMEQVETAVHPAQERTLYFRRGFIIQIGLRLEQASRRAQPDWGFYRPRWAGLR